MTSPRLALESPYGRLYRHPLTPLEAVTDPTAALKEGLLMPSVTNVIGVMDKPYLMTWHGSKAAQAAVDVTFDHPGLIQQRPAAAKQWIKDAAVRHTTAAADLGTQVHDVVERLSRGESVDIPEPVRLYVESWHRFVEKFSPEFLHLEATCYGAVPGGAQAADAGAADLRYAGTADFICRINGGVFVSDYKSGRSIHTEAALQLSALAHAEEITLDSDEVVSMPRVDGGLVVHLTPDGFRVYQAQVRGEAWDVFCGLRRVWDFHAENLASRSPLLIGSALRKPGDVVVEEFG